MKYFHAFSRYAPRAGGYTLAVDAERRIVGVAVCAPGDQYSRKEGRRIAEGRILKCALIPKAGWLVAAPVRGKSKRKNVGHWLAMSGAVNHVVDKYHTDNVKVVLQ